MTCGAAVVAAASSANASAGFIDRADLPDGDSSVTLMVDGVEVEVTSHAGNFASKNVAGTLGTGISGGNVSGEIDGSQYIQFAFSEPVVISSLSIAHLYTAGNYGDLWNERAKLSTDLGEFHLEATGATVASWTGSGIALNDSPAVNNHGGAWTVGGQDIFGGAINWLQLSSGNPGGHPKYGDFGFVGLAAAPIPAPGAGALIMLASLLSGRSRRRASAA